MLKIASQNAVDINSLAIYLLDLLMSIQFRHDICWFSDQVG